MNSLGNMSRYLNLSFRFNCDLKQGSELKPFSYATTVVF